MRPIFFVCGTFWKLTVLSCVDATDRDDGLRGLQREQKQRGVLINLVFRWMCIPVNAENEKKPLDFWVMS